MSKLEAAFVATIVAPIVPTVLLLFGWWGSIGLIPDASIPVICVASLAIGCVVDILFLRNWVNSAYSWNEGIMLGVLLFYSMCVFGFFMGVPVFNLGVGAAAGIFWGRRSHHRRLDQRLAVCESARVARASAFAIGLACLASAYFATRDISDTARNLQGMLGLSFTPTDGMVVALMAVGGPMLVAVQYWLARRCANWSYRIRPC